MNSTFTSVKQVQHIQLYEPSHRLWFIFQRTLLERYFYEEDSMLKIVAISSMLEMSAPVFISTSSVSISQTCFDVAGSWCSGTTAAVPHMGSTPGNVGDDVT